MMISLSKDAFGWLSMAMALLGYIPYAWMIFKQRIRPHVFSWLIWAVLVTIIFATQFATGAGPGAWATGITAFFCILFVVMSFKHGKEDITGSDWPTLVLALMAIPFWIITKKPLFSVIWLTAIDALARYPTIRKLWSKPFEESAFSFGINGIKFMLSLLALEHFTLTTALYPVSCSIFNVMIVTIILWRRRRIN